jgi:hypothetical protein
MDLRNQSGLARTPYLQFVRAHSKRLLRLLALCDVTHKAGKETPALTRVLGKRHLYRELSTALVQAC